MRSGKLTDPNERFFESVKRALPAAARRARRIARMYGTPIYIWEDGKVVAKSPRAGRSRIGGR
jgi:hypothetical protein